MPQKHFGLGGSPQPPSPPKNISAFEYSQYRREIQALRVEIDNSADIRVRCDGEFIIEIATRQLNSLESRV